MNELFGTPSLRPPAAPRSQLPSGAVLAQVADRTSELDARLRQIEGNLDPGLLREMLASVVDENRRLGERNNLLEEKLEASEKDREKLRQDYQSVLEKLAHVLLDKLERQG